MNFALGIFALLPGLALGSFLNVVAARLPAKRSIADGRSQCGSCSAEIAWHDNVPLVSYLVLRGRCRSCGAKISFRDTSRSSSLRRCSSPPASSASG